MAAWREISVPLPCAPAPSDPAEDMSYSPFEPAVVGTGCCREGEERGWLRKELTAAQRGLCPPAQPGHTEVAVSELIVSMTRAVE